MHIGIAQINSVVGDFPGNAKRILAAYRECIENGAEIVVLPEMALVGYPPCDLLFKSQFVPKCLQALDYLADEVRDIPLIVGYVDECPADAIGKPYRNAAAFLHNGKVLHKIWKTLLPAYDVFDERRYFEPGENSKPIEWNGLRLGITICEDIWTEDYLHRPLYQRDPIKELADHGVDVILNLSASPYSIGKPKRRFEMLTGVAQAAAKPLVYCNCIGGNDQLIFDGNSLALDAEGRPLAALNPFDEQCLVVDVSQQGSDQNLPDQTCPEDECYKALVLGLRDYAHKCGFTKACLGLSGGIDSALTAAIACDALGSENIHGLTMPSQYSSDGSVGDSIKLAENLGMTCDTVPIGDAFESVKSAMRPVFGDLPEDLTEENMQARIRGVLLMSLSNKSDRMLLTTGNKSELAVGYCTMYG
ncbi:MAG: NAD+ synthase, partial [Akkermansiaceae bacterium]|nr:NAD+ synthase [Akkermansiaceae bacterium]